MRKLIRVWFPGRPLLAAALIVALAAFGGFALGDGHVKPVKAANKYTEFVGGGRGGISIDAFRPRVINVNQGDSVEFTNPYEEIHTVTFLGPDKLPDLLEPIPGPTPSQPPKISFVPKAITAAPATGAVIDGTKFVNSGLIQRGGAFLTSWTASFPNLGSFELI